MKVRLLHLWEVVSSGYWFVPSVMTVAAGFGAYGMLYIDRTYLGWNDRLVWLYSGGAEGAKTLLSTVAGSIITVASVVFSITIAALTQASSQFGPRLLRNFMRDKSNQVVLGTFVATFLYCLLVLRTIHGKVEDGIAFVPQASVTGAVLLAIASIAVLIYFIHHVSVSLQAPSVVAAVRRELLRAMDKLAVAEDSAPGEASAARQSRVAETSDASFGTIPPDFDDESCPIASTCDGYIEAVDYDSLMHAATKANLVLRLDCRAGNYVIAGNPLLHASPAGRCDAELAKTMNEAFICGDHRTSEQDFEYSVRQMVEVGVRALSPGINDPFTAINCIDALGSVVCRAATNRLPGPYRHDASGTLRVIVPVSTFSGLVDLAFNQLRQYGRDSVAVTIRLLEVIRDCGLQATCEDHRQALLRHALMVYRQSQDPQAIPEVQDRADVQCRWEAVLQVLGADPADYVLAARD